MFQRSDMTGGGGATAQLSLRDALVCEPAPAPSFASGLRARLAEADLVVDLGLRIGSREWFRGLATCTALCFGAISLAPDMTPVAGASPAPMADAQWDRARSLAFAPRAYGADTGRRMAPTDAVVPLAESPERPSVDLVATLGRGDGFARVLERSGVAAEEAPRGAQIVAAHLAHADKDPRTPKDQRHRPPP
ncbi:MAG: M23 family peptidase, partial [Sphingomonadaceae bacterium]